MSYFVGIVGAAISIIAVIYFGYWLDHNLAKSAASELLRVQCCCTCDGDTAVLEIITPEEIDDGQGNDAREKPKTGQPRS